MSSSLLRLASARPVPAYASVVTGAALATIGPIADGDIYWHLAAGRTMRASHALLTNDPFTTSAAGRPWIDVHWLFQVIASAIHDASGFIGLTFVATSLVALAACCTVRTAERVGGDAAREAAAAFIVAGLFAARHLVALRPALVTLVGISLFLAYLERWRCGLNGRATRWLALGLPFVQLGWTNCQGLSLLGPALLAAYGLGELLSRRDRGVSLPRPSLRQLAAVLVACSAAALITPYGMRAWLLPFSLLARLNPSSENLFSTAIAENVPPWVLARTTGDDPAHFFLIMGLLALAFLVHRPRIAWGPGLALAGLLGLAIVANRNILLFYLSAPALLGPMLARARPTTEGSSDEDRFRHARGKLLLPALGLVCLCFAAVARVKDPIAAAPTPFRFPEAAARLLADTHAEGSVFAPDHQGGYLTFYVPAVRPYLDTRLVLHTREEYAAYLALLDRPESFDELDARERFDYVVLTTGLPGRYLGLAAHLLRQPRWHLVTTDGTEFLFSRKTPPTSLSLEEETTRQTLVRDVVRRFGHAPALRQAATLNLARLLIAAGEPDSARDVLAGESSRAAAWLRARAFYAAGALPSAEALTILLLGQEPDDADGQALAATLHLARGNAHGARAALGRSLALEPFNPEARAVLAHLEATREARTP